LQLVNFGVNVAGGIVSVIGYRQVTVTVNGEKFPIESAISGDGLVFDKSHSIPAIYFGIDIDSGTIKVVGYS
jgi:hypothetical protein